MSQAEKILEHFNILERDQFGGMAKKEKADFIKFAKDWVLKAAISDAENGRALVGERLDNLRSFMLLAAEEFLELSPVKVNKNRVSNSNFISALQEEVAGALGDLVQVRVASVSSMGDDEIIFPKNLKLDTKNKKSKKYNSKFNVIENPDSEVFKNLAQALKKKMG